MFRTIRIIKLIFLYFPKKKRGGKKMNKNEIFSQANLFRKIPIRPNSERNRAEAKLPAVIFHGRSWIVSNGSRKASNRVLLAERCVFAGFSRRLARNERHLASAQKFFVHPCGNRARFAEILSVFALPCRDFGYASRKRTAAPFRNAFDNLRKPI